MVFTMISIVSTLQIATSRPKRRRNLRPTVDQQIRDMTSQFPSLHTSRVLEYLPDLHTLERGVMASAMRMEEEADTLEGTGEETDTLLESQAGITESMDLTRLVYLLILTCF